MENKLNVINEMISKKTFGNGLYSYAQANCQCTLTDNGYRVYRPPNKTQSADGDTMWGGVILKPFELDSNFLIKGHTYIFLCHIKGKSNNTFADAITINNNAGWAGRGGLTTELSNVKGNNIGTNFNGELDFYYRFTVSGDIMKTCTTSYSSFVAGTSYNCYRDWKIGFDYTSTGEWGTDLYFTNFRCYDITGGIDNFNINKNGVVNLNNICEKNHITRITCAKEILVDEIYEI